MILDPETSADEIQRQLDAQPPPTAEDVDRRRRAAELSANRPIEWGQMFFGIGGCWALAAVGGTIVTGLNLLAAGLGIPVVLVTAGILGVVGTWFMVYIHTYR
jgi:hypothetical protein